MKTVDLKIIFATILVVLVGIIFQYLNVTKNWKRKSRKINSECNDSCCNNHNKDDIFASCRLYFKMIKSKDNITRGNQIKLEGLYKQAIHGDCDWNMPINGDTNKILKWNSWNELKGMKREDAAKKYIILAQKILINGENNDSDNDELNGMFEASANKIKGYKNLGDNIKLELYGLYKMSTIGDCNINEPSRLYMYEHTKWNAWNKLKGKYDKNGAKQAYIDLVNRITGQSSNDNKGSNSNNSNKNNSGSSMGGAVSSSLTYKDDINFQKNDLFNKFDLLDNIDYNEIKEYIISNNIDINYKNEHGTTFLAKCIDEGQLLLSENIIKDFNADVNLSDNDGYTPLHCASMSGNIKCVNLLLKYGADKSLKSIDDETAYDLAETNDIKEILKI